MIGSLTEISFSSCAERRRRFPAVFSEGVVVVDYSPSQRENMAANQQFCLRWNNHQRTLISVFDSLLESRTLVDCTLAAEGQYLEAHKVVLSACSPYLGVSIVYSYSVTVIN